MNQPSPNNPINELNPKTSINNITNSFNKAVSPENFQKILGKYNPQFQYILRDHHLYPFFHHKATHSLKTLLDCHL